MPGVPAITISNVSSGSFTAAWTAPADNGGKPISGYKLWIKNEDSNPTFADESKDVGADIFTNEFTGLYRATKYFVYIVAVNAEGQSLFDNTNSVVTKATVSGAASDLVVSQENDSNQNRDRKVLHFTSASDNGGADVTSYNVYSAPLNVAGPTANASKWLRKQFTSADAGWETNNVYFWGWELSDASNNVWITAVNAAGESAASELKQAEWFCPKCNLGDYACYGRQNKDTKSGAQEPICPTDEAGPYQDPLYLA